MKNIPPENLAPNTLGLIIGIIKEEIQYIRMKT